MLTREQLDAIEAAWLKPCPNCDAGLPGDCTHPDEDPRTVIAALAASLREAWSRNRILTEAVDTAVDDSSVAWVVAREFEADRERAREIAVTLEQHCDLLNMALYTLSRAADRWLAKVKAKFAAEALEGLRSRLQMTASTTIDLADGHVSPSQAHRVAAWLATADIARDEADRIRREAGL